MSNYPKNNSFKKKTFLQQMDRKYNSVELELYDGNTQQKTRIKELWKLALDYDEKYRP